MQMLSNYDTSYFSTVGTFDDHSYILMTKDFAISEIKRKYGSAFFKISGDIDIDDTSAINDYVNDCWLNMLDDKKEDFTRIAAALRADYNPIHNYDRTESVRVEYTGSESNDKSYSGSESDTVNYNGTESNTRTYAGSVDHSIQPHTDTSNSSVRPYNNTGSMVNPTRDTVEYGNVSESTNYNGRTDTDQRSFTNRNDARTHAFNNRKDTDVRTFNQRADITTAHIAGNIGITTNQQMILSEVELRQLYSLFQLVLHEFYSRYCVRFLEYGCGDDYY